MDKLVRVSRDRDSNVAVITIDNPPVNALSPGVPEGIWAAIDEMNADPAVKIARPRQLYLGPLETAYVPIEER